VHDYPNQSEEMYDQNPNEIKPSPILTRLFFTEDQIQCISF
jgi:hypothetical protein